MSSPTPFNPVALTPQPMPFNPVALKHMNIGKRQMLNTVDIIALVLVLLGGIGWGVVGVTPENSDHYPGHNKTAHTLRRIFYILVGVAAIYLTISLISKAMDKKSFFPISFGGKV